MAQPTGLVSTIGVGFWPSTTAPTHEDLVDIVTILDSFQTPFFSSAPKVRAKDVVHSWTVDTLQATSTGGAIDGDDYGFATASSAPTRLFNATQVFRRDVGVSDRERASNPAGIRDMYEHQVMKKFKEVARDFEARSFSNIASTTASGDNTTPSRMASIRGFAITTVGSASGGITTADIISLSETMFNNGAEPDSLWFAPASKRQFVNATITSGSGNVRNIAATDQRLVANVDVFETPFNQLYAVITDRFIPISTNSSSGAYFIGDRSMAKVAMFRPPQHKPMGKSGDNTRGIVLMEATLQLDHPSSWGAVSGVTNG
jgi:hypothetical protein